MHRLFRHSLVVLLFALLCPVVARGGSPIVERFKERVEVKGISRVTHLSSAGVNLWVDVENRTASRLVLKRAVLDVVVDGEVRMQVSLRDRVVVARKSDGEVLLPLRFTKRNTLSVITLLRRLVRDDIDEVSLNIDLRGGTMLFRKNFEVQGVTLVEVLGWLGSTSADVLDFMEML